jgi:branched-chain amino acid transport system substrate-binding protein
MLDELDLFGTANPVRIGLEAPLTGDQRANGRDMWRGALLAAEEINRDGGLLGRPIQLLRADDRADPDRALTVARRLLRRGADALIGPYNSSVGLINLPFYLDNRILPVHLTSTDETSGQGVTIQPKNSQIAPVEESYILSQGVRRVSMLVDPSSFTAGMADRLEAALKAKGVSVERFAITPGGTDYDAVIGRALASDPGLVYVSTYFPEGSQIARALAATGTTAQRFLGLGNVDPAFVREAGLDVASGCVFSGTPEASQIPTAKGYVKAYEKRFNRSPGVWGTFTYDSLKLLAESMQEVGSTRFRPALEELLQTSDYQGETGTITIDPLTGNRVDVPVFILRVDDEGEFVLAESS